MPGLPEFYNYEAVFENKHFNFVEDYDQFNDLWGTAAEDLIGDLMVGDVKSSDSPVRTVSTIGINLMRDGSTASGRRIRNDLRPRLLRKGRRCSS